MRVNVDDVAFMDRRFKLLGGRLGLTWQEALGRCLPVWALAYQRRSAVLPAGDVDALAERPGFAAAMISAELAAPEGDEVYLCGVTERIDFLLIQDAKREQARAAKLAAAGVSRPPGRSRGKRDVPGDGPAGPSPGMVPRGVPGEGPYPPDLAPDLAPEDQNLSLARAIPPSTEPARAAPSTSASDAALRHRQAIRAELWTELAEARRQLAAELELGPAAAALLAQDPGERALASKLLGARSEAELEQIAAQARHAIAVSAAEAREARSVEWLTGVMFDSDRVWRRLLGKRLDDVGRGRRAGPRGSAERALEPVRKIRTL